jgi:hypothetical protein
MASTRRRIRFSGTVLSEHGVEGADCTGSATEVSLPGQPPQYVQFHIDSVSKPLPDGNYIVSALGQNSPAHYVNGQWLAPP